MKKYTSHRSHHSKLKLRSEIVAVLTELQLCQAQGGGYSGPVCLRSQDGQECHESL